MVNRLLLPTAIVIQGGIFLELGVGKTKNSDLTVQRVRILPESVLIAWPKTFLPALSLILPLTSKIPTNQPFLTVGLTMYIRSRFCDWKSGRNRGEGRQNRR